MRELRAVYDWEDWSIRLTASPSLTARVSYYYVQEIGHFYARENYFTERKNLESYLIVLTLAGKGVLHYQGRTYELEEEQLFFINCKEYQCYFTSDTGFWEMVWIHFDGSESGHYYNLFSTNGDGPVLVVDDAKPIASLIDQLIQLNMKKDIRTEIMSSKLIVNLLTEVVVRRLEAFGENSKDTPKYIESIQDWLEHHYTQKVSLDGLAYQFSISKYHLSRQFKKYVGFTVNQYLLDLRLKKAMERLKYSDAPIYQIAEEVGFENTSYFVQTFQKNVGLTPLHYRKAWNSTKQYKQ